MGRDDWKRRSFGKLLIYNSGGLSTCIWQLSSAIMIKDIAYSYKDVRAVSITLTKYFFLFNEIWTYYYTEKIVSEILTLITRYESHVLTLIIDLAWNDILIELKCKVSVFFIEVFNDTSFDLRFTVLPPKEIN